MSLVTFSGVTTTSQCFQSGCSTSCSVSQRCDVRSISVAVAPVAVGSVFDTVHAKRDRGRDVAIERGLGRARGGNGGLPGQSHRSRDDRDGETTTDNEERRELSVHVHHFVDLIPDLARISSKKLVTRTTRSAAEVNCPACDTVTTR